MKHIYSLFILFVFSAPAFGQAVQSRGAFIEKFNIAKPAFPVVVDVDKPDRVYAEGDVLQAFVESQDDGFLYLFYRDADAKVTVLFPNQYEQNNRINRNVRVPVPGPNAGFRIRVGAPFGHELLKAVVSKKPLPFIDSTMDFAKFVIASVNDNTPYASVNDNVGNALADAMQQATGDSDWAEAEINIRTVSGTQPPNRPPPSEGGGTLKARIHLILAADISSTDAVGGVVEADTYNLRTLIENNVARDRLNIIDLHDKHRRDTLTRDAVFQEISNLNPNSDDTIFFFYSGHGAYDTNKGQYFALASQEQVLRSEVLDALKNKRARLSILVSDCCYNQADLVAKHARPLQIASRGQQEMKSLRPLVETLFFEAEGVVDITASEKGTYGFIYPREAREENGLNKGSIFTWNFRNVLTREMYASKNWEQIFNTVRDETNKDFQQVFAPYIPDKVQQTELKPHAFTLP